MAHKRIPLKSNWKIGLPCLDWEMCQYQDLQQKVCLPDGIFWSTVMGLGWPVLFLLESLCAKSLKIILSALLLKVFLLLGEWEYVRAIRGEPQ